MSAKINVQQRLDRKIYKPFTGVLQGEGISIADGLEQAIKLWMDKFGKEQRDGKK